MLDIIEWVLIGLSVPVIIALAITTVHRARALSDRIDEFHEEQKAQQQCPESTNPYEALSRIIDIRSKIDEKKQDDYRPEPPEEQH